MTIEKTGSGSARARTRAAATATPRRQQGPGLEIPAEARHEMIATAAYFRAELRGFCGDVSLDDWLAAEAEIDDRLRRKPTASN